MGQNLANTDVVVFIEMKVLKKKFRVPQILTDSSYCAELQADSSNEKKKGKIDSKTEPQPPKFKMNGSQPILLRSLSSEGFGFLCSHQV